MCIRDSLVPHVRPLPNHYFPPEEVKLVGTRQEMREEEKSCKKGAELKNATTECVQTAAQKEPGKHDERQSPKEDGVEEEQGEEKVEKVYQVAYLLQFRAKCQNRPKDMRPIEIPLRSNMNFKFDGYDKGRHSETAEAIRNLRILLNKLANDNFARVSDSILNSDYDKEIMGNLVNILFNKCVNEHRYIDLYMKLVDQLFHKFRQSAGKTGPLNFKKLFIEKCQSTFEEAPDDFLKELPGDLDEEEKKQKKRQRMLGNTKLIGQLFIRGALTDVAVTSCFTRLFKNPKDDSIENLCYLLLTIGKKLYEKYAADAGQAMEPKKSKIRIKILNKEVFDDYIDRLIELKQTPGLPSRMKFMIMDVVEARDNDWKNAFDKFVVSARSSKADGLVVYRKKTKSVDVPEAAPMAEPLAAGSDPKVEMHEMRKKSMNEQNVFGRNIERFKKTQIDERVRVIWVLRVEATTECRGRVPGLPQPAGSHSYYERGHR
eukprot:TRINITY_DN1333_c0_g1_i8.p1 TRINITY_DN1333_c0_g1~~TRINITY_DN1333_c0_g1_i8.p1  ORF type:complete len:487 (-),score=133.65 TRINITY_DN1333_c0_g1_i8:2-1462(-)